MMLLVGIINIKKKILGSYLAKILIQPRFLGKVFWKSILERYSGKVFGEDDAPKSNDRPQNHAMIPAPVTIIKAISPLTVSLLRSC